MNNNLDIYINKYKNFVDDLAIKYNYDLNLKHLLYVIVTAFIFKYGINNEKNILECFSNTIIHYGNINFNSVAYFNRKLNYKNGEYYTNKYVVIDNKVSKEYITYIDTIIHEFNHAINSIKNEIKEDSNKIYLRTGLSYAIYKKDNINIGIGKSNDYVLEEVINTRQTEEIINLILNFDENKVTDNEIHNLLISVKREMSNNMYKSEAYKYESLVCKSLLDNKSFINTLANLRFEGNIDDINDWFDNVCGIKEAYKKLNNLLFKIQELKKVLSNRKILKNGIIKKIQIYATEMTEIINRFNDNSIYK